MIDDVLWTYTGTRNPDGRTLAYCDVQITFRETGRMTLRGFRIMAGKNGQVWVSVPSKKGEHQWFDQITIDGTLRKVLFQAAVDQYAAWVKQAAGPKVGGNVSTRVDAHPTHTG